MGRLVEKKYRLTEYKGPGGIIISHFDRATGDSWVPKTNYRLSVSQMKYIEELNSKFWQGTRYDGDGKEIPNRMRRRSIIRMVGELDTSHLPPMTGREKLLVLNQAIKARKKMIRKRRMMVKMKQLKSNFEASRGRREGGRSRPADLAGRQMLEVKRKREHVIKSKPERLVGAPERSERSNLVKIMGRGELGEAIKINPSRRGMANAPVELTKWGGRPVRRYIVWGTSSTAVGGVRGRQPGGLPIGWTRKVVVRE